MFAEMKKANKGAPPKSILKQKKAMYMLVLYWFIAWAATIFQTTFSIFSSMRLNLGVAQIGYLFSSMGIFQVFFRFLFFGKIRKKFGDLKTSLFGLANYLVSYSLLGIVNDFWSMMFVLWYISICGALSRGIIMGFISRSVDGHQQGSIMGITSSMDYMAQISGPIFGTWLLGFSSLTVYSLTIAGISSVAFALSLRIPKLGFEDHKMPGKATSEIKEEG